MNNETKRKAGFIGEYNNLYKRSKEFRAMSSKEQEKMVKENLKFRKARQIANDEYIIVNDFHQSLTENIIEMEMKAIAFITKPFLKVFNKR